MGYLSEESRNVPECIPFLKYLFVDIYILKVRSDLYLFGVIVSCGQKPSSYLRNMKNLYASRMRWASTLHSYFSLINISKEEMILEPSCLG